MDELKAAFQQEERAIEHEIDHTVHTFSASVDVSYNVRRPSNPTPRATHTTHTDRSVARWQFLSH